MSSIANLTCDRNCTFTKEVLWSDASGNPVDLTGYHAYLQVRTVPAKALVLDLSDTTIGIVISAAQSKITVSLTPAQTLPLTIGIHRYDLLIKSPSGEKHKVIEGQFVINDTITEAS
jgi:hypothetical protein